MKNITPLLSVIMPVYNTQAMYVEKAVESVLNQSMSNFELIVVDDFSDKINVKNLVSRCADQRIIFIRNERNEGLGKSRNIGMQSAHGEFIGFIDSDDFIDPYMFEQMLKTTQEEKADIVGCDFCFCDESGNSYDTELTDHKQICKNREQKILSLKNGAVWNKIFKRELLEKNKISFPENVLYEDNLFMIKACEFSKTLIQLPEKYYHYRQIESSLTHDRNKIMLRTQGIKRAIIDIYRFAQEQEYSTREQICVLTFCRKVFAISSQDREIYLAFRNICKERRLLKTLFKDQALKKKLVNIIKAYIFFPIYIRRIYVQNKQILKKLK